MKLRLRRILFTQRDSKVGCAESYLGNGKRREPRDILRLSSFCLCRGYPCFFRPLCPLRPSVRYGPLPFPAPLPAAAFCSLRPSAFSGPFACCGLLFAATLSPPSLPLAAVSSVGSDRDHVDTDRLKCGFDLGRELVVRDQDVDVFDRADAPESPSSDFRRIG